jgi:hypothetical protein
MIPLQALSGSHDMDVIVAALNEGDVDTFYTIAEGFTAEPGTYNRSVNCVQRHSESFSQSLSAGILPDH